MVDPRTWYTSNRVLVRGYNNALATSMEHINNTSLAFTLATNYWTTVTALQAASGNADDAAAGAGMITMRICGAALNGTFQYSDVTLTGTTDCTATTELYAAVYCAYGLTWGANKKNTGIIYVFDDGATTTSGNPATPEECLVIPAGDNMATCCTFIAPPSTGWKLKRMIVGGAVQPIVIELRIYPAGLVGTWMVHRFSIGANGIYNVAMDRYPIGLDAGEMIVGNALSTTAAGQVSLDLILEKI